MNLGTLFVNLNADSKGLLTGFAKASAAVEKFAKETKKLANDVSQVSGALLAVGGAAVALAASVDNRTARSMDNLKKSTQLLAIQVADILEPAVKSLTAGFRQAADVVAGLDPKLKAQIGTFAVWAAGLAVGMKALSSIAGLVSGVAGAFSALAGGLAAIGLGPLLGIIAGLAVVAAGVAALHFAFRTNLGGIGDAWKRLTDWLGSTWNGVIDTWAAGLDAFFQKFLTVAKSLAGVMKTIDPKNAIGWNHVQVTLDLVGKNFTGGAALKAVATQALDLGKAAGGAFVDEWKRILKDMGLPDFQSILNGSKGKARGPAQLFASPSDLGTTYGGRFGGNQGKGVVNTQQVMDDFSNLLVAQDRAQAEFGRSLDAQRAAEIKARAEIAAQLAFEAKRIAAISTGSHAGLTARQAVQWGVSTRKQDEKIRREDLSPKQRREEDSAAAARKWAAVGQVALTGITAAMGEVGGLVQSAAAAIQGGGGVWGAVIAVIMEVVKKTESAMKFVGVAMEFVKQIAAMVEPLVKPIFDALTNVLGTIMSEIGPLFEALQPLAEMFAGSLKNLEPVFSAIGDLIQALAPVIEFIGEMLKAMDTFLAPLLQILGGIIKVVATAILGIMIALNALAGLFGDEKAKAEAKRLGAIVDAMWAPDNEARNRADHDAAAATLRNAAAQDEAATAAKKVAEALTNVPSGYKLALARLGAMQEGDSAYGSGTGIWGAHGGGGSSGSTGSGGSTTTGTLAKVPGQTSEGDAVGALAEHLDRRDGTDRDPEGRDRSTHGTDKMSGPGYGGSASGGLVVQGDVVIYGTDQHTLEALLRDAQKVAARKRSQKTGSPIDPTGNIR